jgi:hypothetical protein
MSPAILVGLLLVAGEPAASTEAPAAPPAAAAPTAAPAAPPSSAPTAPSAAPTATQKQRLAVLELKPEGASAELATTLSQVVAEQAGKTPGFDAISQAEISTMLNVERQKQLLGCADESCLAEIGGALGAKLVLNGTLGKLGDSYVLSLQLLDTHKGKIQARESRTVSGGLDPLVAAAKDLTYRLLTGKPLDTTGKIRFAVLPAGTAVTVDGTLIGHAPLDNAISLEQGIHRVHAEADGYVPYDNTLQVVPGTTLFNEINLVSTKPLRAEASGGTQRTLGWILIGAAAATLGAGIYFGVKAQQNYNSYSAAPYKIGGYDVNGQFVPGAQYYEDQTTQNQTPANICFAVAGGLGAIGIGLEIWGLALGSSSSDKHVEVTK